MAAVDLGRYRRIVQMFWDPEPTNENGIPVWCLGRSYVLNTKTAKETRSDHGQTPPRIDNIEGAAEQTLAQATASALVPAPTYPKGPDTPPESVSSSFSSSLAYDEDYLAQDGGWPPAFLDDFESKFWMTYRSEFQAIAKSTDPRASSSLSFSMRIKSQLVDQNGFTSDSGWGCMIRSGQSLLANAMAAINLGRDWRRGQSPEDERKLLSWFADDPRAPYSIHQFVQHGAVACGKYPGEWFGPSATARCIQEVELLLGLALVNAQEHQPLRVYSTGDGPDVYEDKFMEIAKPDGSRFHPTLILVGTRLGIDKITPVYWEALIAALQMPQSVGIAGGRPASSHYFIGAQGLHLFYLDPHHTRPALPFHTDPSHYSEADVDTVHTRRLRRLHVRELDPSMLVGFLIRDEDDWAEWRRNVKHVQGKAVIHVADHDPVPRGGEGERDGAIDEVETLSDDDGDTVLNA
ncbi:putative cysteine protease atg4 [Colletotrichum tanaceti]|uniref:Cysteine protease n=1 Tax=Colletotrichum tanaceti TaxID=1306861 RepID=A0A4U6XVM3_9PEZI|nr:putative cysteine protease atg4 [Colletotrichum tanaceti]TKW60024.1 putative cysteine protease atg4 [Colletotrichum tanaceti]